ncbi:N-acetylglucosamine-6-phosphate deacetylase [Marivita hallyeonensis]|uniref:N-acetylglucosamine 6-phosphate deacetylase n=1 Tax=Marivita hallyeonensis TaxID=996342 RepID=A0A1M5WFN9_9RHOB|nr:N-acetylglucosamine-6-phosphate deacetylase [Marivita hallyeonensis]SHH86296.1 N-acetylglucosamine 6-phosphate deacetylase [Marivita hallyeonensis]
MNGLDMNGNQDKRALVGADVFDGQTLRSNCALLLDAGLLKGVMAEGDIPDGYHLQQFGGGTLLPGFVDLQVNGGGGVLFNEAPTVDGLRTIAKAHRGTGTGAVLPTLITDTKDCMRAAVDAVGEAFRQGVPGVIGIHFEGPHLAVVKKGAHDPNLIRPMDEEDEAFFLNAAKALPNVMVTVAPENVRTDQITRLAEGGVIVSLGHTDCSFADAQAAFAAGARCVTHLFNAMSQLGSREPGLVGAALATDGVMSGLIADGIHVHPATMRIALAAQRPGSVFLVTDAMPTVGSDIQRFTLNGRTVARRDGRLTLEDGTLAGADLDFPKALRVLCNEVGIDKAEALAMATSGPASVLRTPRHVGRFVLDQPANVIHLGEDFAYLGSV